MRINVLDFTEYPGPRYQRQGTASGEEFYICVLNPTFAECYKKKEELEVNLDGTAGYPSSFLDEAFGELVYDFTEAIVESFLRIKTKRFIRHLGMIQNETFPQWEKKRIEKSIVVRTINNKPIYYLDGKELKQKQV